MEGIVPRVMMMAHYFNIKYRTLVRYVEHPGEVNINVSRHFINISTKSTKSTKSFTRIRK